VPLPQDVQNQPILVKNQRIETSHAAESILSVPVFSAHPGAWSRAVSRGPILLVLTVPFRRSGNALLVEAQARNGLECWADNFGSVVVAATTIPEHLAARDRANTWVDVSRWDYADRVELVPLPWAYRVVDFLRAYRPTRRLLGRLIARCDYLQFAVGGMLGDWAAVAAAEASTQRRGYAFFTDFVPHRVMLDERRGLRRLKSMLLASLTRVHVARIVRNSAVALLHGGDCYDEYRGLSPASYLVHNIHTKPSDCLGGDDLDRKVNDAASPGPLRLCYTGRMVAIKGPLDWVRAVAEARRLGADVEATWLGDGPLLAEARDLARRLGLAPYVAMPGYVANRVAVLAAIRRAHLMPFCHTTLESPRCLLESLICATPIAGYRGAFAEDLVTDRGGGVLCPRGDWRALGRVIAALADDRARLAELIRLAGRNGARFNDVAVFRERGDLIKKHLDQPGRFA